MSDINSNLTVGAKAAANSGPKAPASRGKQPSGINANFTVSGGPVVVVKKVDQAVVTLGKRTPIVGKQPDTVKESMDQIANSKGPRHGMKGQQNSKNYLENGDSFRSTSNAADSDAGN